MNIVSVAFFKGILMGISISLPVGPIAILCIRRTLQYGALSGIFSGLGAATADALYGALAGVGVNFLSSFLMRQYKFLSWIGALFLGYLGIKIFFTVPERTIRFVGARDALSMYISTFFLTLGNPMTILAFSALIAGFGIPEMACTAGVTSALVTGVFIGSTAWWILLAVLAGLLRSKIDWPVLILINKISGIIIVLCAIAILFSLRYPFFFSYLR